MRPLDIRIQDKEQADEPLFPEFSYQQPIEGELMAAGILEAGMGSGLPSLFLVAELPDKTKYWMQISYGQWDTINGALTGAMSRWGLHRR